MTIDEALAFVCKHGVVLESAKGPVPRLTEAIAGEPIKGSWWAHANSRHIFAILQKVSESPDILVCRLVNGKITLVHRRIWPALVRMADHLDAKQLAQVRQEHTSAGHHVSHQLPFPEWVPLEVMQQAQQLSTQTASRALAAAKVFASN